MAKSLRQRPAPVLPLQVHNWTSDIHSTHRFPILTHEQLIGFLKGKTTLPFEREKQDRPLP
jgi:hypothetical protein